MDINRKTTLGELQDALLRAELVVGVNVAVRHRVPEVTAILHRAGKRSGAVATGTGDNLVDALQRMADDAARRGVTL